MLGALANLVAIEYYIELGPLLPSNSITLEPSANPSSPDACTSSDKQEEHHIKLWIPYPLPVDSILYIREHPVKLEFLKRYLERCDNMKFDSIDRTNIGCLLTVFIWLYINYLVFIKGDYSILPFEIKEYLNI